MQTFEAEQPWGAQNMATARNQAAADQYQALRQYNFAQQNDPTELARSAAMRYMRNDAGGGERWNMPFRDWLGQQNETHGMMPSEIDQMHKTIWGQSPQEEEDMRRKAAESQARLSYYDYRDSPKPIDYSKMASGIESRYGSNFMDLFNNYNRDTETASIPQPQRYDANTESWLDQPARQIRVPGWDYDTNFLPIARSYGYRDPVPQLGPQRPSPADEEAMGRARMAELRAKASQRPPMPPPEPARPDPFAVSMGQINPAQPQRPEWQKWLPAYQQQLRRDEDMQGTLDNIFLNSLR